MYGSGLGLSLIGCTSYRDGMLTSALETLTPPLFPPAVPEDFASFTVSLKEERDSRRREKLMTFLAKNERHTVQRRSCFRAQLIITPRRALFALSAPYELSKGSLSRYRYIAISTQLARASRKSTFVMAESAVHIISS